MSRRPLLRCSLAAILALGAGAAPAQDLLSSSVVERFQQTVGNRVEAVTILGGDHGAAGGIYTFDGGNNSEISITKIGGSGVIAEPHQMGSSSIKWAPLLLGNIGWISTENEFKGGLLEGNRSESSFFALQAGAGARFYFGDHFTLTPELSGIYGHTENDFYAENEAGRLIRRAAGGDLVDWEIDTWTIIPALQAGYEWTWGRTVFSLSSRLSYFYTESFDSTSPLVDVEGDSITWENKLDVDIPVGLKVFGRELHTGGYFSRTDIGGGAADGLGTDYLHTVNGRLALDMLGTVWGLKWLGVGGSYSWGEDVDGWSAGVDMRLKF